MPCRHPTHAIFSSHLPAVSRPTCVPLSIPSRQRGETCLSSTPAATTGREAVCVREGRNAGWLMRLPSCISAVIICFSPTLATLRTLLFIRIAIMCTHGHSFPGPPWQNVAGMTLGSAAAGAAAAPPSLWLRLPLQQAHDRLIHLHKTYENEVKKKRVNIKTQPRVVAHRTRPCQRAGAAGPPPSSSLSPGR